MTSTCLLRAVGLTKTYPGGGGLRGVDFQVERGQAVCLVGPSGGGKTTLLRCLNRLVTPDRGDLWFDGRPVVLPGDGSGPAAAVSSSELRRRVGMVFQHFDLWPNRSVLANVALGPQHVLGLGRAEAEARGRTQLEQVGLRDKWRSYPHELSGGERQRVAIARALAMAPDVLLLDEPTSALDPARVGEVVDVIERLRRQGVTLVLVTHQLGLAAHRHARGFFGRRSDSMVGPGNGFDFGRHERVTVRPNHAWRVG